MVDRRTIKDPRFDNNLDRIVRGEHWPGESMTEEDEYTMELSTARMLTAHLAPMRDPPAGVGDRIWQQTQKRIDAHARDRFHPSSGAHPLLTLRRRQLIAMAAAVLLMLSAITPVGPQVVAMAQEVLEARGWIERAETPGDASTEVVLDSTELPAGAPPVAVDEIIVPYDPNTPGEVEPYDPQVDE